MNRDIAATFLQSFGHTAKCVEGGAEAIEAVSNADFDVVLMDVRMPKMDGLEATRRIRAIEGERGRVPIVALTAQAFTDQIAECRNAGMDSHLSKPFDPDSLLAAIARAVSVGRLQSKDVGLASMASSSPVASTNHVMGSELLVLDQKAFERTVSFLSPEAVASYLDTIVTVGQALLLDLRAPKALTSTADTLVETAHKLASSAGMFGFERLANLGRRFERAVKTGAADVKVVADGLRVAIEDTRKELQTRTLQRDHSAVSCPTDAVSLSGSVGQNTTSTVNN
jgi:CheY-like chemotaxis protein/HPt (histidine-containing phosphotransfer) domain-containing protein